MRAAEVQLRRADNGALGVGEFFVAAVIAAVVDEFLGGGQVVLRGFPRVRCLAKGVLSILSMSYFL